MEKEPCGDFVLFKQGPRTELGIFVEGLLVFLTAVVVMIGIAVWIHGWPKF